MSKFTQNFWDGVKAVRNADAQKFFMSGLRTRFVRIWVFAAVKVLFISSVIGGASMINYVVDNIALLDKLVRNDFAVEESFLPVNYNHDENGMVASATNPDGIVLASTDEANKIIINNLQNQTIPLTEEYVDDLIRYNIEKAIEFGYLIGPQTTGLRGCLYIDEDGSVQGTGRKCRTGSSGGGSSSGASLAIGSVVTGATQDAVLFVGAGGVLAQDPSGFNYYESSDTLYVAGDLGIGNLATGGANQCVQANIVGYLSLTGSPCGSSLTPWTSNINADGFALNNASSINGLEITSNTGVITTGTWNGTALADAYVDDTLTASLFVGSGSTTNAIDLATAEVAGLLPIANGGTNASTSQTAINNISQLTTNGDLLYNNGTNSTRLARGANGECLQSNATTLVWGACGSSTPAWSSISTPTGNLSLAHGANTTAFTYNSLTSGNAFELSSSSLTSGTILNLVSTSTAATSNTQKVLNVTTSGANGTASQITYGGYFSNTHTGSTSTNIGLYSSASGGTNNYAAIFENGNVGIGTIAPSASLQVNTVAGVNGFLVKGGSTVSPANFSYTGSAQTYVVPNGITTVRVVAVGGAGATINGGAGGLGGSTATTVTVTPGETLNVYVGGAGVSSAAGFNGGGTGGITGCGVIGGGGGGASDIRQGGTALANRIVIAGGGGGAGGGTSGGAGGTGGGTTGGNGTTTGGGGGAGGTASAGGNGGGGNGGGGNVAGAAGSLGVGGAGGNCTAGGGGGGGGGYYGGGGGGGSSAFNGGGGGGGSGFSSGTNNILSNGVGSGNGSIIITPLINLSEWQAGDGASIYSITSDGDVTLGSRDFGAGSAGPVIHIGRNNNATTTGAGSINFQTKSGSAGYVWRDNAGNMRVNNVAPTHANDTAGTVIGAQSSTRETKQDIMDYTDFAGALQMVADAPLHTFRYIKDVEGYGEDSELAKTRIGYIADEVPADFMWGNVIDQVSVNGILMASVKALNEKIDASQNPLLPMAEPTLTNTPIILKTHLYLSSDSVGQATIDAGETSVRVNFVKPYQYLPIVTTTPNGRVGSEYWITQKDADGFTIRIDDPTSKDIIFDWHAFATSKYKLSVESSPDEEQEVIIPEESGIEPEVLSESTEPDDPPEELSEE